MRHLIETMGGGRFWVADERWKKMDEAIANGAEYIEIDDQRIKATNISAIYTEEYYQREIQKNPTPPGQIGTPTAYTEKSWETRRKNLWRVAYMKKEIAKDPNNWKRITEESKQLAEEWAKA